MHNGVVQRRVAILAVVVVVAATASLALSATTATAANTISRCVHETSKIWRTFSLLKGKIPRPFLERYSLGRWPRSNRPANSRRAHREHNRVRLQLSKDAGMHIPNYAARVHDQRKRDTAHACCT